MSLLPTKDELAEDPPIDLERTPVQEADDNERTEYLELVLHSFALACGGSGT